MKNKIVDTFNHVTGRKGFDYDQVTDQIFIGTNMCCQFGFDHELLKRGVKADVSLEEDRVDAPIGVDYFLWLPTKDQEPITDKQLDLGIKALSFFEANNIPTYIHCKNGHGRAVFLYIAYLINKGLTFKSALDLVKNKRPGMHLSGKQIKRLEHFKGSAQ